MICCAFWMNSQLEPPIVVGHSMGGIAALRAALRQPERFSALILLDPVLFPPRFIASWNMVRRWAWDTPAPADPGALKRRRTFDDLEEVIQRLPAPAKFSVISAMTALRDLYRRDHQTRSRRRLSSWRILPNGKCRSTTPASGVIWNSGVGCPALKVPTADHPRGRNRHVFRGHRPAGGTDQSGHSRGNHPKSHPPCSAGTPEQVSNHRMIQRLSGGRRTCRSYTEGEFMTELTYSLPN